MNKILVFCFNKGFVFSFHYRPKPFTQTNSVASVSYHPTTQQSLMECPLFIHILSWIPAPIHYLLKSFALFVNNSKQNTIPVNLAWMAVPSFLRPSTSSKPKHLCSTKGSIAQSKHSLFRFSNGCMTLPEVKQGAFPGQYPSLNQSHQKYSLTILHGVLTQFSCLSLKQW